MYHDAATLDIMKFSDGVAQELLLLGVPETILQYKEQPNQFDHDFCYIGAISDERNSSEMIQNFLSSYGESKSLVLIGNVEDNIKENFKDVPNVFFKGELPQKDVFAIVKRSKYAVSYVPACKPYDYHVPAKLLEYATMGKKIISNNSLSNINAINALNINTCEYNGKRFPPIDKLEQTKDNMNFDATEIFGRTELKLAELSIILQN